MKQELRDFFVVKEWVDVRKVEIRVKHTKNFLQKNQKNFLSTYYKVHSTRRFFCVWFFYAACWEKFGKHQIKTQSFVAKKYQFKFAMVVWAGLAQHIQLLFDCGNITVHLKK